MRAEYGLWQDYGTGKEVPRGNRRTKQAQSQTGLSFALQEGGRPKANSGDLGKTKSAQGSPLVFSEILYVGDEHQRVHGGFTWKAVPGHHC